MNRADKLINDLIPYTDNLGLTVQRDKDGGDTAYRQALLTSLLCMSGDRPSNEIESMVAHFKRMLEVSPGRFVRHPDKSKWYSNPTNFSRDQWDKVWLMLIVTESYKTLFLAFLRQLLRLGFHQNYIHDDGPRKGKFKIPDLPGIGQVRNTIRFLFVPIGLCMAILMRFDLLAWMYILLAILDAGFLADLYFRKKQVWDYDSLIAVDLIYAKKWLPTPLSLIMSKLYLKTDWEDRIRNNYSRTPNDIAPLGEYYIQIVKETL